MKKLTHKRIAIIVVIAVAFTIIAGFSMYKQSQIRLLDKSAYKSLYKTLQDDAEEGLFTSQQSLRNYITDWADSNNLKYTVDDSKNIVFTEESSSRKKKISPTVILVHYNYETVYDNARALASAALIAKTELNSSKKTVIFVNNVNNDAAVYENLNSDYFTSKTKVIYLDYSKAAYVSRDSFAKIEQSITIPTQKDECTGDTMIRIHIGGLVSDCIDTNISSHPNPINNLETVLTRLKSKAVKYHISDLKVNGSGDMYPTSVDLDIIINSYAKDSIVKYLDKRVKAYEKANKDDYPDCFYTYEIIDDESKFEHSAYSDEASDSLATLLFTIKNGAYRFEEDSVMPEGFLAGDIYGINCVKKILCNDNGFEVRVSTQAIDEDYIKMISDDNRTSSKLSNCNYEITSSIKKFHNKKDSLIKTLKQTYFKVSDLSSGKTIILNDEHDKYFTPMSYLYQIDSHMDIVHVRENKETASVMTNMILCYIKTKGNFMSL